MQNQHNTKIKRHIAMTGFDGYNTDGFYDEMFTPDGRARSAVQMLVERIEGFPEGE